MTQNPIFKVGSCFVCQADNFHQIELGQNFLDASDFYESNHEPRGFPYVLVTCQKCNHSAIQTSNPCWMPTRKYDFIEYGEPTEHYSQFSRILRGLNLDSDEISIHTFSIKDFYLANFLAKDLGVTDFKLHDHAGCSDGWLPIISSDGSIAEPKALSVFETEIRDSKKNHQIILITRFFDHVANPHLLQKILNLSSPTRHIVFDLNDYDQLFKSGTLEFLWNERRNLLHRSNLETILQNNHLRYSLFSYESAQVSPTLIGVISERLPDSLRSNVNEVGNVDTTNLVRRLTVLRKSWQIELSLPHKLGIVGASHKGVSLAQFILDENARYSLHDDKEVLKGKTPPVGPPLGFHSVSDFDFSQYTHVAITTTLVIAKKIIPKLRASGFEGEILDFDCKKLD